MRMQRLRKTSTVVLLIFAIFTAGYAVGKEVGIRRALSQLPPPTSGSAAASATGNVLQVWYFHSTKRCKKCNRIEAYAKETIETRFADAFADGTITWQAANMDDVWNADAATRYGLVQSSLVLVETLDGEEQDYTVCNRTWDLTGDKDAFIEYVASEVEIVLDGWSDDEDEE